MLDVFKGVVTLFRRRGVYTDSVVFRLHYNVTVAILLVFCIIVGFNQYVRRPITCDAQNIPYEILDVVCWDHSIFTAVKKKAEETIPLPGGVPWKKDREVITLRYYQWVFLCLFLQAILFYIPRWLWKNWEGGKLKVLSQDLGVGFISDTDKSEKKKLLLEYLRTNRNNNTWWTFRYFLCEFLALNNVVGQMFMMNRFLNGAFWTYGWDVLTFIKTDEEERTDPMTYVFPRVVKCTFYRYGESGTVQKYNALCVLPLNIFNEKIYVFLWFWFVLLLILTTLWVVLRIATILSRDVRYYVMSLRFTRVQQDIVHKFVSDTGIGDWYFMYMLGENLDNLIFRDIMQEISGRYGPLRDSKIELTEHL